MATDLSTLTRNGFKAYRLLETLAFDDPRGGPPLTLTLWGPNQGRLAGRRCQAHAADGTELFDSADHVDGANATNALDAWLLGRAMRPADDEPEEPTDLEETGNPVATVAAPGASHAA